MFAKFSVKKPYTVLVGVVLVIVLGAVAFTRMTTDLLPDMNLPYAIVVTTDMGASPEEVEKDVTAPIEAAMATTSNIKNISSESYDNYSMVVLEFEQDTNMDTVMIEMQQKLDQLKGSWSDSVGSPIIMQIDPDMMPIMIASADVEGMDQSKLSDYVTDDLVPVLESIEGVASVTAIGTLKEDVQITLDQKKIDALNRQIKKKIEEQFEEAAEELEDAADAIESGKDQLDAGANQLADKLSGASNEVMDQKLSVYSGEAEMHASLASLKQTKTMMEGIVTALQKVYDQLIHARQQANDKISGELDQITGAIPGENIDKDAIKQMILDAVREVINGDITSDILESMGITAGSIDEIPALIHKLSQNIIQMNTAIAAMEAAQTQIDSGKTALSDAMILLEKSKITGILEMSKGYAELAVAESQMAQGQAQLDAAKENAERSSDLNSILSLETLNGLLMAQNFSMPAGYVQEGGKQYLIRVGNEISSVEELKDLVLLDLGMDGVEPIRVSDIASVEMTDNSGESYSRVNGNPAITLSIEKQTGYSTGSVTDSVLKRFEQLKAENPNLRTTVLMDQGVYIDMIVESVLENMIVGAILAIIVLALFLKDVKPTIVIACSIPLSVIFAIVLMYFADISLNIISLSGLALGIGMLVDNSIVVIENIYRLRSEGYSVRKAAVEGASQVTGAIIGSTLTTICVFAPIIFTEGITRQLFVDIALTIAFTLTASLLIAMTFVPMMAAVTLKKTKQIKHGLFDRFLKGYEWLLKKALKWKPVILIGSVLLLVTSIAASFSRGFSFMDMDMETGQLSITVSPAEDTEMTFEELTEMSDEIVERILTIEGIDTIGAMTGGNTMSMMGGTNDAVTMYLLLDEKAGISSEQITDRILNLTEDLECSISTDSSASDMTALMGSGISVEIKGRDIETLQRLAAEAADALSRTEGTIEVDEGLGDAASSLTIAVDREKAAEYGFTVAQVFQVVYAEMASDTSATTISTDLKDYEVYIRSEEQADTTLEDIRRLKLTYTDRVNGEESEISLSRIADFKEGISLSSISRDAQTRYVSVTAGVDKNHNVTLVSNEAKKELAKIELPEGYSIRMAGEDEMIQESMNQLYLMLLLAVIFIYLVMVAQFQSLLSPFIIMFTIPLAFTGGFFALYFTGYEVSVVAMIGFVMLAGIIVNNGIVLVDYMNQLRRGGMEKKEAVVEAGKTRLRPVLMTALTTILAMSTMAAGLGSGSEMMQPMAIVEVGGLVYGTVLTLFVVPCIYDLFHRNKSMVEEEL